jgi:hypothetical protein
MCLSGTLLLQIDEVSDAYSFLAKMTGASWVD